MCHARDSVTDRPTIVLSLRYSPTGKLAIGPWWATRRSPASSTRKIEASSASQSRVALSATVSSTGWTSAGERAIAPRISLVAVCCSSASLSERFSPSISACSSAWDLSAGTAPPKGVLHSRQNLACGGLSWWHRGQGIPEPPQTDQGWNGEPRVAARRWRGQGQCRHLWWRTQSAGPDGGGRSRDVLGTAG